MKRKKLFAFMLSFMLLAGAVVTQGINVENVYAASDTAVANKAWGEVEPILKTKLGTSYQAAGRCTGFVYWALKNAYGVDWGDNSPVEGLEKKLVDAGITKVAEGTSGGVSSNMKPGDIVIFSDGSDGTHCAILGEGGILYHARSSVGVVSSPTLQEWMSWPDADKNCDRYRVYRGLQLAGSLSIIKSSANADITDGNGCYSLAGAKYGLYQGSTLIGTLVTDENGRAVLDNIPYGNYTLREISASKGYALDARSYGVTINSPQTVTQAVTEKPQGDPAAAVVYKVDGDTHESWSASNLPQGSASLSGAEYTVRYYDGYYTPSTNFNNITPTRSWVIKTNENGKTMLTESLLVKGDPFYHASSGAVTLPLGTMTIQETKAPEGYLLDNTLHVRQITPEGTLEGVHTYNIPVHKEDVKRGGIKIRKNDMQTAENSQGDATFAGAEFSIINRSENAVFVDGKEHAKDEVVKVITTDKDGVAQTAEDCLPYGEYTIAETKVPEGYLNEGILERDFSIRIDGQIVDMTKEPIINDVIRGGVQVEKWDRELGKSEALAGRNHSTAGAGSKLSGIEFTITNKSKAPVIAGGKEYAPDEAITVLTSAWNEGKKAYTVETPDDFLPYGTYEIKETKTNKTYLLTDGKAKTFEIREHGKIVAADREGTAMVFKNSVVRGDLEFIKVEDGSMKRMPGIPFKLTNTVTKECHVIVTDDNGYASTASGWNKHTANTNANDKLLAMDAITEKDLDDAAGVWFGLGESGSMAEVNDTLGAVPYGTYTLDEMRCEANTGHDLIENVTIKVSRNGKVIHLGTITNDISDTDITPDEPESDEPQQPEKEQVTQNVVKTGDEIPVIVIIAALLLILSAVIVAKILYRKKHLEKQREDTQQGTKGTDGFFK